VSILLLQLLGVIALLLECLLSVIQIISEKGGGVLERNEFALINTGNAALGLLLRLFL